MRAEIEKLGLFYLGRQITPDTQNAGTEPVLYDSRDLTTHGVIVGMTGSGKTGLGLAILEEAAIDGIPIIAIDPKGDVANLQLTFPNLEPSDFAPWVSHDAARAEGKSVDDFASAEARKWREGLAAWDQDGDRIRRMREAAEITIYTPGSSAGRPLSVLGALAPGASRAAAVDDEAAIERASAAASSLLALAGVDADPLTSREHILIATLLQHAWKAGRAIDVAALVQAVHAPPFTHVGVLDLDTFFPAKDRTALSLRLNNLIASPSFAAWGAGEPMSAASLLYTSAGAPKVSIISIAHLADAERMFVVSMLLAEIVTWVRAQPGTSSLRALLYFDEVMGYLPPVANPPSKTPLMTLLKQARASGLGVLLATQNPVDLDYKALSNAGTWFLGRLQTERDKARLLDGLTAAGLQGASDVDATLSSLGKRRFLLHNVHAARERNPLLFESRWALSYLRGPLTKEDIRRLSPQAPDSGLASAPGSRLPASGPGDRAQATGQEAAPFAAPAPGASQKPILSADIPQLYLPREASDTRPYRPFLYGSAQLYFGDSKQAIDEARRVSVMVPLDPAARAIDWDLAQPADAAPQALLAAPPANAQYTALPAAASSPARFAKVARDFDRWLGRTQRLDLFQHAGLKMTSRPGELEAEFLIRARDTAREKRDAALDHLRRKWDAKLTTARDRAARAGAKVAAERHDARQSQLQTTVSFGATILGAVLGRRGGGLGTLGRATTAARGVGRAMKDRQDVARAEETAAAGKAALAALEAQAEADLKALADGFDIAPASLERVAMRPRRGGTSVDLVAVVWQ
ncbi:MAG: DUF87 domain-containing protein [Acidobacteriota bacterium]|nr:DUF87 domain-containing protein [Acidobacteriota bacterium]